MNFNRFTALMRNVISTYKAHRFEMSPKDQEIAYETYMRALNKGALTEKAFISAVQDWCAFNDYAPSIAQLINASNSLCRSRPADYEVKDIKYLTGYTEIPKSGAMPEHVKRALMQMKEEAQAIVDAKQEERIQDRKKGLPPKPPMTKEEIRLKHLEFVREYNARIYEDNGSLKPQKIKRTEKIVMGEKLCSVTAYQNGQTEISGLSWVDPNQPKAEDADVF